MKTLLIASLLLAPTLSATAAPAETPCASESHYQEVSRKELDALVKSKQAFVIDVNSKESFDKNHVPTAIHYGSNEKNFASVLPKDKNALIVAYCGGPMCGAWKKAAEAACTLGYTQIKHFKGGISGWVKKID